MLSRISRSRLQENRAAASLFFKSLVPYSTTASAAQPHNVILADYLINSLGFSKGEAISTSDKVKRSRPIQKDPALVINFLSHLGLSKTYIKDIVSKSPQLLLCNVDKTLKPKISYLQGLGLSGSELVKLLTSYQRVLIRGLDNHLIPRIECLRQVLGSDELVLLALKKFSFIPGDVTLERVAQNAMLLRNNGFSNVNIAKLVLRNPSRFFLTKIEKLQDILNRVENYLGIPREAAMFYYGVDVLWSISQSRIDMQFEILRSYGWSDDEIFRIVRMLPLILNVSKNRMRRSLDYYMKEVGFTPDYMACRPSLFTLNLEGRVKPRNEVLKVVNEKRLNKRKAGLYRTLCLPESKFLKNFLLPHKDKLPGVYESYMKKVRGQKSTWRS